MPRPGDQSNIYGDKYEAKWIVNVFARIMADEADYIALQQPGPEGEGCEFTVRIGDNRQYHQVKRQHADGKWTLRRLETLGVLGTAFRKTVNPNSSFCFISVDRPHLLEEISNAAREAGSLERFMPYLSIEKNREWKELVKAWRPYMTLQPWPEGISPEIGEQLDAQNAEVCAFEHLQRVFIEPTPERHLEELVKVRLERLIEADSSVVFDRLVALAREKSGETLHAEDLWAWVEKCGYRRGDYSKEESVLAAIDAQNRRCENLVRPIRGEEIIPRPEVEDILGLLFGEGRQGVLLVTGQAGCGKSAVLVQVAQQIRERTIPCLHFRVDQCNPTNLPQEVGIQLGLHRSPVYVLGNRARGRPCLLIIDQLDAVSSVSGRNQQLLSCIHEIVRQTQNYENMRVLVACRKFDLEKDYRLRELVAESDNTAEVEIRPFTDEVTKRVLTDLGFDLRNFTQKQLELLCLPVRLSIFVKTASVSLEKAMSFSSEMDLYNDYWEEILGRVNERTGEIADAPCNGLIDTLLDRMTEDQALFVHEGLVDLDKYRRVLRILVSEGVLTNQDRKLRFFHEGFFDYLFAARFVAKRKDLIKFLKSQDQHLFTRAPLRQVLLHLHSIDPERFRVVLGAILHDPEIRPHLKKSALDTLGRLDEPCDGLWKLLRDFITESEPAMARITYAALVSCTSLFPSIHEDRILSRWLESDDPTPQGCALRIIDVNLNEYPVECLGYLKPHIGQSMKWNKDILYTLWRHMHTSREAFDLFIQMAREGLVEEVGNPDYWAFLNDLPKHQPLWAVEAIQLFLERTLARLDLDHPSRRFMEGSNTGGIPIILDTAKAEPLAFLEATLPFFLELVRSSSREKDGELWLDPIWSFPMYREHLYDMERAFYSALESALCKCASLGQSDFSRILGLLRDYGDYASVNFLIVRALSAAPPAFSDYAVDYISENPQRLKAGWSSAGGGDFQYWAARELIEHISSTCSPAKYNTLEMNLLDYSPKRERTKDGYRSRGYWQFVCLSALDPSRRSKIVETRILEVNRKLERVVEPPVHSRGGVVGSPIDEESASKMKDDHWLKAMAVYNTEDGSTTRASRGFLLGGAHQLSGILENETKRDPERFARLALRMAGEHPYYFYAILRGLKGSDIDEELIYSVLRHFHYLEGHPAGRWMIEPIAVMRDNELPDDILEIAGELATEAKEPIGDDLVWGDGSEENRPSNLITTAINTTRGAAADALGNLLHDHPERMAALYPYVERAVSDPSLAVRSTAANGVLGVFTIDDEKAVELFLTLIDVDDDALLATHLVDRFLYFACVGHLALLKPVLERMLESSYAAVRQAGARHVCLSRLRDETIQPMLERCLAGDKASRIGVAVVAAANLFNEEAQEVVMELLTLFFNDDEKEVRNEAASCFRNAKGADLRSCRGLIRSFLSSRAFEESLNDLIWPMEKSTAELAEECILLAEVMIEAHAGDSQGNSHWHYHARQISDLVLRAYQDSKDDVYRERCLGLIDRLILLGVLEIDRELEKYER